MLEKLKEQFDKVRLQHFSTPFNRRNGKTIAVLFDGDTRYVGVTECSRKDAYSKKKGRGIALGRAFKASKNNSNNGTHFTFNINSVPQNIVDTVPSYLYTYKTEGVNND